MPALLEITLASRGSAGQQINRWNYLASGTPSAVTYSYGLASAFGALFDLTAVPPDYPNNTVLRAISDLVTAGTLFQQLTVINVYDDLDFFQTPFVPPYTGKAAGEVMPPFAAFGFRTTQTRRDIKRATKRFGGVSESQVEAAGNVSAAALELMATLATRMGEVLEYDDLGQTLSYAPVVAKKQRYDPETQLPSPTGTAYRYFPDPEVQFQNLASSIIWEPYNTVRSQTSRQYGRGA